MPQTAAPGRVMKRRKAEIIEAAAECFMERGYHATTVDDVAARLGATKGRGYHHYATKTDLFFDVHREGMQRLFDAQEEAKAVEGSARDRLIAMLHAHAVAMLEHHTFETVVAQGVQVHRFDQVTPDQRQTMQELISSRDEFEALFKTVLSEGIAEGSVPPVDVSVAVKVMLRGLQWSIFWYRPKTGETPGQRAELASRMVAPLVAGFGPA